MKKYRILLILVFIVIVVVQLVGSWTGQIRFEYWVKPLIMVWITTWFLIYSKKHSFATEVVVAFFFCWIGDMLLMLSHLFDILFYAGVAGFFIGQINFIRIFIRHKEYNVKGWIRQKPWWLIPYILFLAGILILLLPEMDGFMKVIITIYGLSLVGMSIAALNRKGRVSSMVFNLIFVGSIFFVISDSLIAINKFYQEFERSGFIIMATYILAQVLIMLGLTAEKEMSN